MKNQIVSYVEIKTVTWSKDSHGLFDYESKNVQFSKTKIEHSSKLYKEGNEIVVRNSKDSEPSLPEVPHKDNYLFSVSQQGEKNDKFYLKMDDNNNPNFSHQKNLFLIVRSLKNEDGSQKGYPLELGDIIRLGRIEYRVIEFQDSNLKAQSLLTDETANENAPFKLTTKDCVPDPSEKRQCRICLMDETDSPEVLVNPCNCKGTSQYVHIRCLQDWINSKVKKKATPNATCLYWKKLNCEVCKVPHPDLVNINKEKMELISINRPQSPYILLERVFYDKSKESGESNKMMILLGMTGEANQIKLGRGHECDLRENDISVSRLHAYIKYQDGKFIVIDNNSKFGTLILLRKMHKIEKKKIALQIGRTVITFSLKQTSTNNIPVFKNPMLMEKLSKWQSPKHSNHPQQTAQLLNNQNKHKNVAVNYEPIENKSKPELDDDAADNEL